jgi:hypothetical protein
VNLGPRIEALYMRWSNPNGSWRGNAGSCRSKDPRGEIAGRTGKARTTVPPGASLCLAEDYEGGTSVVELARRYGHPGVHKYGAT